MFNSLGTSVGLVVLEAEDILTVDSMWERSGRVPGEHPGDLVGVVDGDRDTSGVGAGTVAVTLSHGVRGVAHVDAVLVDHVAHVGSPQ